MNLADLRAQAEALDLSENDVAQVGNLRHKATWQEAIRLQTILNQQRDQENHNAAIHRTYQSPAAPVVVPVAYGMAYAELLIRNVGGMIRGQG